MTNRLNKKNFAGSLVYNIQPYFTLATRETVPPHTPSAANVSRNVYLSPSPIPISFLSVKTGRDEPPENRFFVSIFARPNRGGEFKLVSNFQIILHGSFNTIYLLTISYEVQRQKLNLGPNFRLSGCTHCPGWRTGSSRTSRR
jgi:hypothetical protein